MIKFDFGKYVGYGTGENGKTLEQPASYFVELPEGSNVDFDIRAEKAVIVNVVSVDGETMFFGEGKVVSFAGKMLGVKALEIVAVSPFYLGGFVPKRWFERNDGVPLQVSTVIENADPMKAVIQREVMKALQAYGASEEDLRELAEDIASGDLEFDEKEGFDFGSGFEDDELEEEEEGESPIPKPAPEAPSPEAKEAAKPPEKPPEGAPVAKQGGGA